MYLAQNLKYLRLKNGETQTDISKLLSVTGYGYSEMTVSSYENGECEPGLRKVIILAAHFNVTVDELLTVQMQDDMPVYLKNLRFLRKKHHMKQQDIAELLRISKADVSKYENGVVGMTIEQFIKLADYFGVTLDGFVKQDLSEEMNAHD